MLELPRIATEDMTELVICQPVGAHVVRTERSLLHVEPVVCAVNRVTELACPFPVYRPSGGLRDPKKIQDTVATAGNGRTKSGACFAAGAFIIVAAVPCAVLKHIGCVVSAFHAGADERRASMRTLQY